MYPRRLLWALNMTRWLMYGVLEFYAMSCALDMRHLSLPRVAKKHTERF